MRVFALTALNLILMLGSVAYTQTETLTNAAVIEMVEAGLSNDLIIRKIGTANSKFGLTAAALIELKRASVPDPVITAMIDRQELIPPNSNADNTPAFSESGTTPNTFGGSVGPGTSGKEMLASARSIAFVKSSLQPSRQALEKELMKMPGFTRLGLAITRYKETADVYVEIGYVSLSWISHRYVYRIYDRRSGTVLAAGETTSWGSLAKNLARNITKSLNSIN
ncbi:MAG: hypothetical protein IT174_17235 [Acidobacteria bacterium]|nr:hypothetical protein [Acidobacteriota bacterium]